MWIPRRAIPALLAACYAAHVQAEVPLNVRLRYEVPPSCPDEDTFVRAVRARTPLARFDDGGGNALLVLVSVAEREGKLTGVLSTGRALPREVSGERCADVVAALALIFSLTIDPRASEASVGQPSAAAPSAPPAAAAPPSPQSVPAPPWEPIAPPPMDTSRASAWRGPDRELRPFWRVAAAFTASPATSSSWVTFMGPSVSGELGAALTSVLAPSFRLSGAIDFSPTVVRSAGNAVFRIYRARMEMRALRFDVGALRLLPYVGLDVGSLVGQGQSGGAITVGRTQSQLWLALSQGVAVELPLSQAFLSVSAEIQEPLRRYRFVFETPNLDIVEVPRAAAGVSVGGGVLFQ